MYAFAYGLTQQELTSSFFGPHTSLGTLAVGALVFAGVALRGRRFNFSMIYRVALPLAVGAFLVVPILGNFDQALTAGFGAASYTAFSILIMLILANMSYRYGIAALWLFGIERGMRTVFNFLGRETQAAADRLPLGDPSLVIAVIVVFAVVAGTMILLSEKELASKWGVTFLDAEPDGGDRLVKQDIVESRCHGIASSHRLSHREEEVLVLLAQHRSNAVIARELFISDQTVKTHVRNIYRKLDIHSRDELFDLMEA